MISNPIAGSVSNIMGDGVCSAYHCFIESCRDSDGLYRLTPRAEPSAYALCFAIFGYHLLKDTDTLNRYAERWDAMLRQNLREMRIVREKEALLHRDKAYLQLLTFTLSALAVLDMLKRDPLADEVLSLLPTDIESELYTCGMPLGRARSGNHAMFLAILLIHARDYLECDTQEKIDRWIQLHMQSMNKFGFWGDVTSMSHLQFQNGYHQYEVLEYLHVDNVPWSCAADMVAGLADPEGHFAPYPGGGGCYDYDAIFILTGTQDTAARHLHLLARTTKSILNEQNFDGGFCESRFIRPRSLNNILRTMQHIISSKGAARVERIRQGLTLLRPRHDRIHTHWSYYSREWGESDLWDSWFRMLTVARIEVALYPSKVSRWGFIDYPGIGYHSSLRGKH